MSLSGAMTAARRRLRAAGIETSGLDARVLAAEAFGLDGAGLIAFGDLQPDPARLAAFEEMIARRAAGEPVGRIRGRREFHGLDLALSPETLEPRPDTETLVDVALRAVREGLIPDAGANGEGLHFADIGTGTGAIAIALAVSLPRSRGVATDISAGALATAAANAERHGVASRLEFRQGDYLSALTTPCGLIVSNPPYIESAAIDGLAREVRDHDPRRALDGGPDGLDAYRAISASVPGHLLPGGLVAVEIGCGQAASVCELFSRSGLANRVVHADLEGRDRVVAARAPALQGTFTGGG